MSAIARQRLRWRPCHRLIPSRFPPAGLFDRVAEPADLEAVFALEALTNERLRDEVGELALVPPGERIAGPGTTPIMAAFTHLNPEGSRFSDGSWGVWYAGRELETALAEARHHRARFMRATREPAMTLEMRLYLADLDARLHDLRGVQDPALYHAEDYAAGQALARRLRGEGSAGIAYDSVRRAGGQCCAVFRPKALAHCRQSGHYAFAWDGREIVRVDALTTVWPPAL